MITFILNLIIDIKNEFDSIQLASLLGVQWVGVDLTFWDVLCVLFFSGTLISILVPGAESDEDVSDL